MKVEDLGDEDPENDYIRFYSLSKTHDTLLPDEPLDIVIGLDKLANPEKLSLQGIYDKDYKNCIESEKNYPEGNPMGCPRFSASGLKEMIVDGKKALRGLAEDSPPLEYIEALFITYPDYFLVLKGFSYYMEEHPEFNSLFDEIVASIDLTK